MTPKASTSSAVSEIFRERRISILEVRRKGLQDFSILIVVGIWDKDQRRIKKKWWGNKNFKFRYPKRLGLCLVYCNNDHSSGTRMHIIRNTRNNTRNCNGITIPISSFGDNTWMAKFFNYNWIIFCPNFLKCPNSTKYFQEKSHYFLFLGKKIKK